jgi:hypothetical protein
MTTLATLKADIADDLARSDLSTQIADAINRAITFYQNQRFWFNETRDETFSTVAAQARYSSSDDPAIPEFVTLDALITTVAGQNRILKQADPVEFELLQDNSASQGEPYCFTYYDITIGLYPIPDDAYTVRMMGHIRKAAPATDDEADNVWMTHGYQLIRSRATAELAMRKTRDFSLAQAMQIAEGQEFTRLKAETSQRIATGQIRATCF